MKNSRFQKGLVASGAYKCKCCEKLTRETGDGESECGLCRFCFRDSNWENHHNDNHSFPNEKENCDECNANGYNIKWREGK